jgi:hypothetical protein
MGTRVCSFIFAVLIGPGAAWAAGGDDADTDAKSGASDPVIVAYERATARKDWTQAAAVARAALVRAPGSAEYHNRYAFALRKGPHPDMDLVFIHYREALRLAPEHRGAHEYIGEAYLMVGDLPKAKQHLAALDRICFWGCEEYEDLKQAVAAYEEKKR